MFFIEAEKLQSQLAWALSMTLLGLYPKDLIPAMELQAHPHPLQLYSQYIGNGNKLDVHQQMNR